VERVTLVTERRVPLRILHLASSERWTGVAEPVSSLASVQQALGHKVWLGCVPGRTFERKAQEFGLDVFDGFHLNRRLNPFHLISDLRLLPRFCRENAVDIVHAHLLNDHWLATLTLGCLKKHNAGRPFIVRTLHTTVTPRNDWVHRKLLFDRTDALVSVSYYAARRVEKALEYAPGTLPHVYGGVNLSANAPGHDGTYLRRKFGIPIDAPVAGLVARMRAGRGLRWLMSTIPQVLERVPDAYFFVAGQGELKHWFKNERVKSEYKDRVKYVGYRSGDLPLAYAATDVSLFLGLGSEGTCRAILEAMACGRPTIGVDQGAVPEIVADGETGWIVRDRNSEDLAEKLALMLGDRRKCAEMGQAARKRVEKEFTELHRAERFIEIYQRLLAGAHS
jgi:glycosyltransferase involved in cell wall biosynthesis